MQSLNNKGTQSNRKSKIRNESEHWSYNKGSFLSLHEAPNNKSPKLQCIKPSNHSYSVHQNLNQEDQEDDGVDEWIVGEDIFNNRANSVNESVQYNKRPMSEMHKSIKNKVRISKPPPTVPHRFKERNK